MATHNPAYMTPDAFCDHHRTLLRKAMPDIVDLPIVNRMMAEAKAKGMTWIEGLEYVAERRQQIAGLLPRS